MPTRTVTQEWIVMAYPTLTELATFVIVLAIGVPSVYLASKTLKLRSEAIAFSEKRKEAISSLIVFTGVVAATFGIFAFYDKIWIRPNLEADMLYVLRDALWIVLILLPVATALRRTRQTLGSIGIIRSNLKKNLALGILTSAVLIAAFSFLAPFLGAGFVGLSIPMIYLLMSCIVIGFGEEIVFRGYIQTRLTAYGGAVAGIITTSLLFVLYNFPMGYFCFSGDILLSLLFALWRLSPGLVYAYAFHRSQNLLPSSILHAFLVWGGFLFGLYL